MFIAPVLKQLREAKKLSQGDIERRTGLLRCYISRVENGHTVPSLETLEKLARALEVSMCQFFYISEKLRVPLADQTNEPADWASRGRGARYFGRLREALARMSLRDREIIIATAGALISVRAKQKRSAVRSV